MIHSFKKILFPILASLLSLLILELGLRLFVTKSNNSPDRIFGVALPPVKIILDKSPPHSNLKEQNGNLVVGGKKIFNDDIWGRTRQDALLGFVPEESSVSSNSWWQTNSIGARSRSETTKEIPPSKSRILLFGDSYAHGYGLPQEETFASRLSEENPKLEVVNFGATGYGIGQALLRFQQLRPQLKYNVLLLVLVPKVDLWRDLNTVRYLGEKWQSFIVLPRFALEEGELKLVRSPYRSGMEIFRKNFPDLSPELSEHLDKYDRFFVKAYFDPPRIIRSSILLKVLATFYHKMKVRYLKIPFTMYRTDSEHLQLAKKLIDTFKAAAEQDQAKFVLAVYPTHEGGVELDELTPGSPARRRWDQMIAFLHSNDTLVLDLLPGLQVLDRSQIDKAYDDSHLGPRGSKAVAGLIQRFLFEKNVVKP